MEPSNFGGNFPKFNNSGETFSASEDFSRERDAAMENSRHIEKNGEISPFNAIEKLSNPEKNLSPKVSSPKNDEDEGEVSANNNYIPTQNNYESPYLSSNQESPSVAADEDLIEKEWVEKAKDVINTTKNDPYEQEKRISALMRDYVLKRYGREVGKALEE